MNNNEKWNAVINNNKDYDGKFYYAVKSTKVFCRPSCRSKPPLKENIEFYETAEAATKAGYRPCKRCRPDYVDYQPGLELAKQIKDTIDNLFTDKTALQKELTNLGVSRRHMTDIFVNQYGRTPNEYISSRRIEAAKEQLTGQDGAVLEIALSLGFESLSAFYTFFSKHTNMSPGDYRKCYQTSKIQSGTCYYDYDFDMGKVSITSDGSSITAIQFAEYSKQYGKRQSNKAIDLTARQLDEYFAGRRKRFDLPLNPTGTSFQKVVWLAIQKIPYGEICSYKQVAEMIENPNASRAVGMASNKNPLLLVIPCHRVVGTNGDLVGYAASLEIKRQLLDLERSNARMITL